MEAATVAGTPAARHPRDAMAEALTGDVLEVGPGSKPFPTAPGARVRYADRPVEGGRDANWPELAGQPWGPPADIQVDLDQTGLAGIADESLDAVIACHVIEHLANPLRALTEFHRVLRPGGHLVLVVPDRERTLDAVRRPTAFAHLLAEFRADVRDVDAAHIREFCASMYLQPGVHSAAVREWHHPRRLDAERIALHRRRSIHVHCWAPEEFAALLAAALNEGLTNWQLQQLYVAEDLPNPDAGYEFGFLLRKAAVGETLAVDNCRAFVERWLHLLQTESRGETARLARFARALDRDLPGHAALRDIAALPRVALNKTGAKPRLPWPEPHVRARLRYRLRQLTGG